MTIKEEANRIAHERSLNNTEQRYDREWMLMEIDATEAKGDALQKEVSFSSAITVVINIFHLFRRFTTQPRIMQKQLQNLKRRLSIWTHSSQQLENTTKDAVYIFYWIDLFTLLKLTFHLIQHPCIFNY